MKDHFRFPSIDKFINTLIKYKYYCFFKGFWITIKLLLLGRIKWIQLLHFLWNFCFSEDTIWFVWCTQNFSKMYDGYCSNMVEQIMVVFIDEFSIFGSSFDHCLHSLSLVLEKCEEKDLVLNLEKCHFMFCEGIILGPKISFKGLEVERAKISIIEKLPQFTNMKGIISLLCHVGLYRRFIKKKFIMLWSFFVLCLKKIIHLIFTKLVFKLLISLRKSWFWPQLRWY